MVEHQYTVSTRKLVSTRDEQEVLEAILEETKPAFPANTAHLHYLLKTPFRYPPSPFGSRFRRPQEGEGVFYCAEAVRTGLAEFSYWRRHFFETSPGTPLPEAHESLTVFNVAWRTPSHLDLTRPPLNQDRAQWTHPDDYTATRALAAEGLCASSCAEVSQPCSVGRYGSGGLGLPQQDFLVLFEQIHVQVAVVLQPAFVDFDGQGPYQA